MAGNAAEPVEPPPRQGEGIRLRISDCGFRISLTSDLRFVIEDF
jgi:hypothetical protein